MQEKSRVTPLIINQKEKYTEGLEYQWSRLENPQVFIENILTPEISVDDTELNRIISGIPTPFARIQMVKYAIEYDYANEQNELSGLMAFYKAVQNEWKGLISCIALEGNKIQLEKIELSYPGEEGISETDNIFEPKGALASMLFEERGLWCGPEELQNKSKTAVPYLYVIRYDDVIIGATNPNVLVFAAPEYKIKTKYPLLNKANNKFIDPLRSSLDSGAIQKLYSFVSNIRQNMHEYEAYFNQYEKKIDTIKLCFFLDKWIKEIENHASKKQIELDTTSILENENLFKTPFDLVFNKKIY